jgi:hypothetical protein
VAVAAIAFTLFHLLQIWGEERNPRLLAAIGLAAGFAFAAKYTAWPAVAYAVGFVALKNRKAVLPVAACAAVVIAPWLLKNWIYVQNPVAPFFNRQFPNPYVMAGFEDTYRKMLAMYHLKSRWQIPLEATVYGSLSGLLGPVFLLAPIGLLALRRREGRQLWLAALVFGVSYFSNITTRFLIPPCPSWPRVCWGELCRTFRWRWPLHRGTFLARWCALLPRRRVAARIPGGELRHGPSVTWKPSHYGRWTG